MKDWKAMVDRILSADKTVDIALVGKYVELHDAYLSVVESLSHAGYTFGTKVNIHWINSEVLEEEKPDLREVFKGIDGIVVPGGFGYRGVEGKIDTIRYARTNGIPFLGLCLGMQCAVIEFARDVCGMKDANSTEFDAETPYPVIDLMPDQEDITEKAAPCALASTPANSPKAPRPENSTAARKSYTKDIVIDTKYPTPSAPNWKSRPLHLRHQPRRTPGRNHRTERPPLLRSHPGPPRIQEPPQPSSPPLRRTGESSY